jgi:hypothetical protein
VVQSLAILQVAAAHQVQRLSVNSMLVPQMRVLLGPLFEPFFTAHHRAVEWHFACVCSNVVFESTGILSFAATIFADKPIVVANRWLFTISNH